MERVLMLYDEMREGIIDDDEVTAQTDCIARL
jgi:hypothetical protein